MQEFGAEKKSKEQGVITRIAKRLPSSQLFVHTIFTT
jgi:hypothetical protein